VSEEVNQRRSIAESLLLTAVEELFEGASAASASNGAPPMPPSDIVAGTIGFAGADMRGAITLVATDATWRRLGPLVLGVEVESDPMMRDMVREVANMVAGRFRNALLRVGVEVLLALPVATRGSDLAVHPPPAPDDVEWHAFGTDAGSVQLQLELSFQDGFVFAGRHAAVVETNEQDLLLF
jgi:CheY-specific phosphatase CheX